MQEMGYLADNAEETKLEDTAPVEETKVEDESSLSAQGVDFSQPIEEVNLHEEAMEFHIECYSCHRQGKTSMCMTNIPHFKEVVIMAFSCDFCGAKNIEVKGGGGISPLARKITLNVTSAEDLKRDVIKSDTCSVDIPELGVELMPGTLGGLVTTVEGLIRKIHDQLAESLRFSLGDSTNPGEGGRVRQMFIELDEACRAVRPYTLILDDPISNSHIQVLGEDDRAIVQEDYPRTFEQEEELGLHDMNTQEAPIS
jgi:zinc finger protein